MEPCRTDETDSDKIVGQNVRGNELPGGRTGARNRLSLRIDKIEEQKEGASRVRIQRRDRAERFHRREVDGIEGRDLLPRSVVKELEVLRLQTSDRIADVVDYGDRHLDQMDLHGLLRNQRKYGPCQCNHKRGDFHSSHTRTL